MTLRIELTPEVEANLVKQADALGLPPEAYAKQVLEEVVGADVQHHQTPESIEAALDKLAEMGKGLPHLSDYALTRESIYDGHD